MRSPNRSGARRTVLALALAAMACGVLPAAASAADEVTVRVEGESQSLLAQTTVPIGDGTGTAQTWNNVGALPAECDDDTAYQAIELATEGDWDRGLYVEEILGETHAFSPNEEYWAFYYDRNYADWGVCDQHLEDGDTVLMQAAVSGSAPDYIPDSVPIAIDPPAEVQPFEEVTFHVTAWEPSDIYGEEDPEYPGEHWIIPPSDEVDGNGYTVVAGGEEAVTDADGEATFFFTEEGPVTVEASVPGSATNWSRAVPVEVCVGSC